MFQKERMVNTKSGMFEGQKARVHSTVTVEEAGGNGVPEQVERDHFGLDRLDKDLALFSSLKVNQGH